MTATARTTPTLENLLVSLRAGEIADATALYVDGRWTPSTSDARIEVFDPATEQVIAEVADGSTADVDTAVAAAKAALPAWSALSGAERAGHLERVRDLMTERFDDFAELAARDVGGTPEASKALQLGLPVFNFGFYADLARSYDVDGTGSATPWWSRSRSASSPASPLELPGPPGGAQGRRGTGRRLHRRRQALRGRPAAGHGPRRADRRGRAAGRGVQPGQRGGQVVGEALVAHPDVAMVSFTGSTPGGQADRRGRRRHGQAGRPRAGRQVGQRGPRRRRPGDRARHRPGLLDRDELRAGLHRPHPRAGAGRPAGRGRGDRGEAGGGLPDRCLGRGRRRRGPLVSKVQHEKVRSYIQAGIDEGAKLVTGGLETGRDTGWFVQPTGVLRRAQRHDHRPRGDLRPVVAILPYADEEEAVAIANDTVYGLAAAVWSGDRDRALRVARRLQAGQVQVNGGAFNPAAPFGGYKQSGLGREAGARGLRSSSRPRRSSSERAGAAPRRTGPRRGVRRGGGDHLRPCRGRGGPGAGAGRRPVAEAARLRGRRARRRPRGRRPGPGPPPGPGRPGGGLPARRRVRHRRPRGGRPAVPGAGCGVGGHGGLGGLPARPESPFPGRCWTAWPPSGGAVGRARRPPGAGRGLRRRGPGRGRVAGAAGRRGTGPGRAGAHLPHPRPAHGHPVDAGPRRRAVHDPARAGVVLGALPRRRLTDRSAGRPPARPPT